MSTATRPLAHAEAQAQAPGDVPPPVPASLWPAAPAAAPGTGDGGSRAAIGMLLDALGHGVVLVTDRLLPCYANRAGSQWLGQAAHTAAGEATLGLEPSQRWQLRTAVRRAADGEWALLMLGPSGQARPVGIVPLPPSSGWPEAVAMLVLGTGVQPDSLAQQLFSRLHRLTPAESQVLAALAEGLSPKQIAERFGVAICTVRTQICTIRAKTNTDSLRGLLQLLAGLPPLMGAALTRPG